MKTKVTILGGGNGAFAAAADLTSRGYPVSYTHLDVYKRQTGKRRRRVTP